MRSLASRVNAVPCGYCGRRFAKDRVKVHEGVCAKGIKDRGVFNARGIKNTARPRPDQLYQDDQGKHMEFYIGSLPGSNRQSYEGPIGDWRERREAFRKAAQQHRKTTGKGVDFQILFSERPECETARYSPERPAVISSALKALKIPETQQQPPRIRRPFFPEQVEVLMPKNPRAAEDFLSDSQLPTPALDGVDEFPGGPALDQADCPRPAQPQEATVESSHGQVVLEASPVSNSPCPVEEPVPDSPRIQPPIVKPSQLLLSLELQPSLALKERLFSADVPPLPTDSPVASYRPPSRPAACQTVSKNRLEFSSDSHANIQRISKATASAQTENPRLKIERVFQGSVIPELRPRLSMSPPVVHFEFVKAQEIFPQRSPLFSSSDSSVLSGCSENVKISSFTMEESLLMKENKAASLTPNRYFGSVQFRPPASSGSPSFLATLPVPPKITQNIFKRKPDQSPNVPKFSFTTPQFSVPQWPGMGLK